MTLHELSRLPEITTGLPTSRAADRGLLRSDVYTALLERILTGGYAPGQRLKDSEVTAWLVVSRTPVREALSRLASVGLVTSAPNRYTLVAPVDAAAITGAVHILQRLYPDAVASATERFTPDTQVRLDLYASRIERDPLGEPIALLRGVLSLLLSAVDNVVLAETLENVQLRVVRYLYLTADREIVSVDRVVALARALSASSSSATSVLTDILDDVRELLTQSGTRSA